ncbi:hypothetical protein [Rhodocyclus gracilis]|nr:hypothetical protein [Rhodocyclus gracilis]
MMSHPRMLPIQRAIFSAEIRRRRLQFAGLVASVGAAATGFALVLWTVLA